MTRRRLIIHMGPPKTGTTAIQSFCHHNRDKLLQAGVLYPAIGNTAAHHALSNSLRASANNPARLRGFETMIEQADHHDHEHMLISSEGWIATLVWQPWGVEDFCQFWEGRGYDVEFIVCIRDLPAWIESAYAQQVKALSQPHRFNTYAQRFLAHTLSGLDIFKAALTPPVKSRALTAIPIPSSSGADLIENFFAALDLSDVWRTLDSPAQDDRNKRPSAFRIEACRRLGRYRAHQFGAAPPGALKWDWGRIGPMLQVISDADLEHGWQARPFRAVTQDWARRIKRRYQARCDRFARQVWGKGWRDVIAAKEAFEEPTEYSPATASDADKRQISDAVRAALRADPVQDTELLSKTFSQWPRGPGPRPTE